MRMLRCLAACLLLLPTVLAAEDRSEDQRIDSPRTGANSSFGQFLDLDGRDAIITGYIPKFAATTALDEATDRWAPVTELDLWPGDEFGTHVQAVAIDGDIAMVGVPSPPSGMDQGVLVYRRDAGGNWLYVHTIPSPFFGGRFGSAIAMNADIAVVANLGAAAIYRRQADEGWLLEETVIVQPAASWVVSVAVGRDRVLIGSPFDDTPVGASRGMAYLYERQSDGNWTEIQRFHASDGASGDQFGASVALTDRLAAIGAVGATSPGGQGRVYLYRDDGFGPWSESTLVSDDIAAGETVTSRFGYALALSGDGNQLVVGAPWSTVDLASPGGGAAFQFLRQPDGNWRQVARLVPSDPYNHASFGSAVALSQDLLLIGSPRQPDGGAVYAYRLDHDGDFELDGPANDIDGDLISSAQEDAFGMNPFDPSDAYEDKDNDGWDSLAEHRIGTNPSAVTSLPKRYRTIPEGGGAMAIEDELAVVAYGDNLGGVHLFQKDTDEWQALTQLVPVSVDDNLINHVLLNFGKSVAIDAGRVAVSAPGELHPQGDVTYVAGSIYLYSQDVDGQWGVEAEIFDLGWVTAGESLALQGDRLAFTVRSPDRVVIVERDDNGVWGVVFEHPIARTGDVSLSGERLLVGTDLFRLGADGSWVHEMAFTPGDGAANADGSDTGFGSHGWVQGEWVAIAAPQDTRGRGIHGSVYVYQLVGGLFWLESQKLGSVPADLGSGFGRAVQIDGDLMAIASRATPDRADGRGYAHLFLRGQDDVWRLASVFHSLDPLDEGWFARALGLDRTTLAISGTELGTTDFIDLAPLVDPDGDGVISEPDSDGDGIPDSIELALPTDWLNPLSAAWDSDGDGIDDLQELEAGTDPFDADDVPAGSPPLQQRILRAGDEDDAQGTAVAMTHLAPEGRLLAVVGAPRGRGGAAHLFAFDGERWTQVAGLSAPDPIAAKDFGKAVAISVSGDLIAVGAPGNDGAVYLYRRVEDTWTWELAGTLTGESPRGSFGAAVAIGAATYIDGREEIVVVGAPGHDKVYSFSYETARPWWQRAATLTPEASDRLRLFGQDLALGWNPSFLPSRLILAIGEPALPGDPDGGAVSLYEYLPEDPVECAEVPLGCSYHTPRRTQRLVAPAALAQEGYGHSLDLHDSGLIVGNRRGDPDAAAIVYEWKGGPWVEATVLAPPVSATLAFGQAVAIHGDFVYVGDPASTVGEADGAGRVYQYLRHADGSWRLIRDYFARDAARLDELGASLDGVGTDAAGFSGMVVGAPNRDLGQGGVYFLHADIDRDNLADGIDDDDDADGLDRFTEYYLRLLDYLSDSDGDGVSDFDEINRDGDPTAFDPRLDTNPLDADSDDDGLLDGEETGGRVGLAPAALAEGGPWATDPLAWDSDGDGISDGVELGVTEPVPADPWWYWSLLGSDAAVFVADHDPSTTTNPLARDSDGNGIDDGAEDPNGDGRNDLPLLLPSGGGWRAILGY